MRKDAPTGPWLLRSWVAEPQRQPCSRVGLPPRGTWVIDEEKEASVDDMFAFGGFAEEASLSGGAAGVGEGRCEVWLRTSKSRQKRKKRVAPKRDMRRPAPDMELWRREGEKNRTDTCPRRRFPGLVLCDACWVPSLIDRSNYAVTVATSTSTPQQLLLCIGIVEMHSTDRPGFQTRSGLHPHV